MFCYGNVGCWVWFITSDEPKGLSCSFWLLCLYKWAPTGLHQSVCPYELVKNCDLCGNASDTHVMYSTRDKIRTEKTLKSQGGIGWGRGKNRYAVYFRVEIFLKGQTGKKDRVTKVNYERIFMTVLFIASMDAPSVYVWNIRPLWTQW